MTCPVCNDRGWYAAELPDSGDTASTQVKCDCGVADRKIAEALR